jgi:hypothetical protein
MYMAPELLAGGSPSARSDVYAVGLMSWFALAGRHPFVAGSLRELADAARKGPAPLPRAGRQRTALADAVRDAIAPDPATRTATAGAWNAALERARARGPGRHGRRLLLAAGVFVALVALALVARRAGRPAPPVSTAPAPLTAYSVGATLLGRGDAGTTPLANGDRVRPGDRLSLEVHASRPAWAYVLNEDERGERYLLFPQPRFDVRNPLPADSAIVLPGPIGGRENAWIVTSAGGREHFLIVVSPEPVAELEAELDRLPAATTGRPVEYARVGEPAIERLRGVGGLAPLPSPASGVAPRAFDRFRALAGRESGVRGVWVRQIVLENPAR